MLSEDDTCAGLGFATHQPDGFGGHDLVRRFVLDHTILVDAALVLEGIGSHDGLVRLALHASVLSHHFGGGGDVHRIDGRVELASTRPAHKLFVPLQGQAHDNLLQTGISRAFSDAVDGAFQLPGTVQRAGKAVGRGQSQIILTVRAEDNVLRTGDVLAKFLDQFAEFPGHVPSGSIGNVQGRGPGLNDLAQNSIEEFWIGSSRILGTEFDVIASESLGEGHGPDGNLDNLIGSFVELAPHVNFARGNEGVDARSCGTLHRVPRALDVLLVCAAEAGNDGDVPVVEDFVSDHVGDLFYAGEIVGGGDGEAGLDDVHS
mmetsp:Transcript_38456/g.80911  ORF Transcript_38456/g.80911 Transcript_38456/m.80911 type:complete len:317 (-) Transcript_38456:570-1520(-)